MNTTPNLELPVFECRTDEYINSVIINLVNHNPYDKLIIDILLDNVYSRSYNVYHICDTNDDYLGNSTAIFRACFTPFTTNQMLKIKIRTKLYHDDLVSLNLLTESNSTIHVNRIHI
jgi:hypothetical protein